MRAQTVSAAIGSAVGLGLSLMGRLVSKRRHVPQVQMAVLARRHLCLESHRIITGATHEALIAEEEYAAATTQAILDVVSSVQSAAPLVK